MFFNATQAQYNVQFVIKNQPTSHLNDTIYLAGNVNKWNPAEKGSQFVKDRNEYTLQIKNSPKQLYQFKLTRGTWDKVESTAAGDLLANRELNVESDTIIELDIAAWQDDFIKLEYTCGKLN